MNEFKILQLLTNNPILSILDHKSKLKFASKLTLKTFVKDQLIIAKGDTTKDVFILEDGNASVELTDTDNMLLLPGSLFGEMGSMLSCPRTANIRAETECRVLQLEEEDFLLVLRRNRDLQKQLLQQALEKAKDNSHRLSLKTPLQKIKTVKKRRDSVALWADEAAPLAEG